MRRILLVLAMVAVMVALAAPNALAQKSFNYGDCVSAVATGSGGFLGADVKAFTETTAPLQSKGEGNVGQVRIGCINFPPGQ